MYANRHFDLINPPNEFTCFDMTICELSFLSVGCVLSLPTTKHARTNTLCLILSSLREKLVKKKMCDHKSICTNLRTIYKNGIAFSPQPKVTTSPPPTNSHFTIETKRIGGWSMGLMLHIDCKCTRIFHYVPFLMWLRKMTTKNCKCFNTARLRVLVAETQLHTHPRTADQTHSYTHTERETLFLCCFSNGVFFLSMAQKRVQYQNEWKRANRIIMVLAQCIAFRFVSVFFVTPSV